MKISLERKRKESIGPRGTKSALQNNFRRHMKRHILTKLTNSKHFRKLDAGEEAKVRSGHGTTDWLQIGKAVRQGCVWSPCLFDIYADQIMRNAGLEDAQAEIKIAGRNNNMSGMQMTAPLWQKVKRN